MLTTNRNNSATSCHSGILKWSHPSKHKLLVCLKQQRKSPIFTALAIYISLQVLLVHHEHSNLVVVANLDLPDLLPGGGTTTTSPKNDGPPDPCESCSVLVKSFEKGMERTTRGKHEGGDTSWEEKNLKSYADSEIRLVEIQEDLCDDAAASNKAHCLSMAEEAEQHIEDWWFKHRQKNVRLHDFLCISKLKKCCPEGQFGPTCQKCMDCHEHGGCDGSGTRGGSGECLCHSGYVGKQCENCAEGYYESRIGGEGGFECLRCHQACKGGCSGPTSSNCTECRPGYARDPETKLCIDINECEPSMAEGNLQLGAKKVCADGTYCVNTDGHYKCSDCHWACETCLGYGPDKCLTCAADYEMDDQHECQHFSVGAKSSSNLNYWSLVLMLIAPTYGLYNLGCRLASVFCRVVGIDEVRSVYTQVMLKILVSLSVTAVVYSVDHRFLTYYIRNLHKSISGLFGEDTPDEGAIERQRQLESDQLAAAFQGGEFARHLAGEL